MTKPLLHRTHPTKYKWGLRHGAPWPDDDVVCARFLRHCGMNDEAIGAVFGRSKRSVRHKIGPARKHGKRFFQVAA